MAGVNFEPNANVAESISSIADGTYIHLQELLLPAGESKYIILTNISELTFKINQILLFSSCPMVSMDGKGELALHLHLNTHIETDLLSAPDVFIYSNSNTGELYNVKGFLMDANTVDEFDTDRYNRNLLLETHCVANNEATGLFLSHSQQKTFVKPIYLGARRQMVLRFTNTDLTVGGIAANINLTLEGNYLTNKAGLPTIPITADNSSITVDNTDITVDQTEL